MKKEKRKAKLKKRFDIKKTLAFRLLIISIILLIILVVVDIVIKVNENQRAAEKEFEGELGSLGIFGTDLETGVYFPENCSDSELILLWESIFNEPSSGINVIADESAGLCETYLLVKYLDETRTSLIIGYNYDHGNYISSYISAFHGNLTENANDYLKIIDESDFDGYVFEGFFEDLMEGKEVQGIRSISNINEANQEFSDIFSLENGTWEYRSTENLGPYYFFYDKGGAIIFQNKTFDLFSQFLSSPKPVNLTQIQNIPNLVLSGSRYHYNILYLREYFVNIGDSSYFVRSMPSGLNVDIDSYGWVDVDSRNLLGGVFLTNITFSHSSWNGGANVTSNSFNITINGCLDSDLGSSDYYNEGTTQNLSGSFKDVCIGSNRLREYYCSNQNVLFQEIDCYTGELCSDGACVFNSSINHAPEFLDECDNLEWKINTSYVLDMGGCWEDDDNDALTYRYENTTYSENLTISRSSNNLTLSPDANWNGTGYFYVYSNDSKTESKGRVDFLVYKNASESSNVSGTVLIKDPKIKTSSPLASEVSIFGGNKTFTITAEDYETIKWYLNGKELSEARGLLSYGFSDLKNNDFIKVEVINGTRIDSKTWTIKIEEDEEGEIPLFDVGEVIFYSIMIIIIIIICLIVWLFITEKNKNKHSGLAGFGILSIKAGNEETNIPG